MRQEWCGSCSLHPFEKGHVAAFSLKLNAGSIMNREKDGETMRMISMYRERGIERFKPQTLQLVVIKLSSSFALFRLFQFFVDKREADETINHEAQWMLGWNRLPRETWNDLISHKNQSEKKKHALFIDCFNEVHGFKIIYLCIWRINQDKYFHKNRDIENP